MNSYEFLELVDLIADVHPFYVENIAKAIRDAGYVKQYTKNLSIRSAIRFII